MDRAVKLVTEAMVPLETVRIPSNLSENIRRHQVHLTALAAALLASGQDREQVRETIDTVFSSFRDELVNTIFALRGGDDQF